jgi:hypothetical protein
MLAHEGATVPHFSRIPDLLFSACLIWASSASAAREFRPIDTRWAHRGQSLRYGPFWLSRHRQFWHTAKLLFQMVGALFRLITIHLIAVRSFSALRRFASIARCGAQQVPTTSSSKRAAGSDRSLAQRSAYRTNLYLNRVPSASISPVVGCGKWIGKTYWPVPPIALRNFRRDRAARHFREGQLFDSSDRPQTTNSP